MLLIVVLALGAALLYGTADFFSGVAARRIAVLAATTINYAVATVVLVIVVLTVGGVWSPTAIASAAVKVRNPTAALAAGPISLLTPLIALLSSAVPVVVALVLGDELEADEHRAEDRDDDRDPRDGLEVIAEHEGHHDGHR